MENEYPWQVALLSIQSSTLPFCGGTLVSNKEVLTARHCTDGATAAYVVLGEHDLRRDDGEKKVRVRQGVRQYGSYIMCRAGVWGDQSSKLQLQNC